MQKQLLKKQSKKRMPGREPDFWRKPGKKRRELYRLLYKLHLLMKRPKEIGSRLKWKLDLSKKESKEKDLLKKQKPRPRRKDSSQKNKRERPKRKRRLPERRPWQRREL
jgi:hypothetical protein